VAISLVQAVVSNAGTTVSFGNNTTAGNCVVVAFADTGTIVTPAVTLVTLGGSAGNFASQASSTNSSGKSVAAIWADPNCAGGQKNIAVNESNAGSKGVVFAYEFSGILLSSILDVSSISNGSSTSWTSNSASTTSNNELWLGIDNSSGSAPTGPVVFPDTR
jgi:hypothetical protein